MSKKSNKPAPVTRLPRRTSQRQLKSQAARQVAAVDAAIRLIEEVSR